MKNKKNYKLTTRYKLQSTRQLRIAFTIRSLLVECLRQFKGKLDYRLHDMPLTIVDINISSDLKVVNCFFVPFNTSCSVDKLLEALDKSKYFIRNYINRNTNLKYSPEIRFYYDSK